MVTAGEGSSLSGRSSSSKHLEIKKWNAVAVWDWDEYETLTSIFRGILLVDMPFRAGGALKKCVICLNRLTDPCNACQFDIVSNVKCTVACGKECQAKHVSTISKKCTVSVGMCRHAYHSHCISTWFETYSKMCPLDRRVWELKEHGR
ncbi:unnamed protein product [Lactuca saligna]|uniref:Zinc finger RING-H2-type domain-containing protein n=1 Tax=Lactuca saligna TaxID=75948 RepID=A0AA36EFG9_LACSI|nr:unnamed protein product [Lactuca saligna]